MGNRNRRVSQSNLFVSTRKPTMGYQLNQHLCTVPAPPIGLVSQWKAAYCGELPLLDLCQAVPDYEPALALRQHLRSVIHEPLTARYTPDEGLLEVREQVCLSYADKYGAAITPEHICLTCGASAAFWLAITTICQAGDEVILQSPCYFDHPMALRALGITPIFTSATRFDDIAFVQQQITSRTKAILLVTPSNPTGHVLDDALLQAYALLARKNRIALILDETYSDFIPYQPHRLFHDPSWEQTLVHIMSFGKTFALTGYRAGLLLAAPDTIREGLKIQDTMTVCQPRLTQYAIQYGLCNLTTWVRERRDDVLGRHQYFKDLFSVQELPFQLHASGSFFAWVTHPFQGMDSFNASRIMAEQHGVLTLPGAAFGPGNEAYIRLALGNVPLTQVPMVIERLRAITGTNP